MLSLLRAPLCLLAAIIGFGSTSTHAQPSNAINSGVRHPIVCNANTQGKKGGCQILAFDRVKNCITPVVSIGASPNPDQMPGASCKTMDSAQDSPPEYVSAIRGAGSKIIYSGTILDAQLDRDFTEWQQEPLELERNKRESDKHYQKRLNATDPRLGNCQNLDWRVVLLSNESSNVLIYGPADISEFCTPDNRIVLVVPVTVIWATIYRFPGNLADPLRKVPGPIPPLPNRPTSPPTVPPTPLAPSTQPYCFGAPAPAADQFSDDGDIRPCDRYSAKLVYRKFSGAVFNMFTQPGTFQGTLSYTPAIGKVPNTTGGPAGEKAPSQTINYDAQLYASTRLKSGWIGIPVVFEKANAQTANLDSLTIAVSYDTPLSYHWPVIGGVGPERFRLSMRPPDFRVQYGPELADSTPHDMNVVGGGSVRLPIVLDVGNQPSAITIFPFFGLEGGNHVVTHIPETTMVFRQVVGFDASTRFPFVIAHSFFGDKPETIDFSWRTRYLSYPEPFTDYVSGYPETLSKQQMTYWRGAYSLPFSNYVTFKVTVQHGALPPDFHYLGYNVNVGLTFANPGYSEH